MAFNPDDFRDEPVKPKAAPGGFNPADFADETADAAAAGRAATAAGMPPPVEATDASAAGKAAASAARPSHSATESATLGALEGLSGGFFDEAHGILGDPKAAHSSFGGLPPADYSIEGAKKAWSALTGKDKPEPAKQAAPEQSWVDGYRQRRDDVRDLVAENRAENPKAMLAGEIGGTLATAAGRIPKTAAGAASFGRRLLGAAGRGAAQGAVYGAGNSEADLTTLDADKAKDFARDVGVNALVGGASGAAGETLATGVRSIAEGMRGQLSRRILNEIAEGETSTTPRGRQQLERAAANVTDEVVNGPDAKAVRAAYLSGASQGRQQLRPIIDKVNAAKEGQYKLFEDAGKAAVDRQLYSGMLGQAALEAEREGNTLVAEGIRKFGKRVEQSAKNTGGLNLRQLRGLTTEAQGIAESVISSSLTNPQKARIGSQVVAAVTGAMDDTLSKAAGDNPALSKAAEAIRADNKRLNALLTIDNVLATRATKEASARSLLVRGAEKLSNPAALAAIAGGGAGVAKGDNLEDKLKGGLTGLALAAGAKALPAVLRAGERGLTSAAISGARGDLLPSWMSPLQAERLARALGTSVTGATLERERRQGGEP